jgi:ANTAR domain
LVIAVRGADHAARAGAGGPNDQLDQHDARRAGGIGGVDVDADRVVRIWAQVGQQSQGARISMAHVCAAAVAAVRVDGAGVTVMVSPTVRETIHATDGIAAQLEELQLTLGEGPCIDAFTDGGPALAADLQAGEYAARWPTFTPAAMDSGAGAVFALPLQIGAIRLGALDLYRSRPGPLSAHELADALTYAQTAGTLLLDTAAGVQPDTAELAWQHDDATVNQAVVHQATGMILVQLGATAEAAFARLRAYAYAHNRSLGEVAREVVDRSLRFTPDPPSPDSHDMA